jgi:tight adherence protein B
VRLRVLAALSALAACVLAASAAGAAERQPRIAEAAGAGFPDRTYVLSLPAKRRLSVADVRVTENGTPVRGVALLAPDAAAVRQFAVVLAVDTSNSMRGAPIRAAVAAARAFAAQRNPNQRLAIVAFNGAVRVVQPFTADGSAIVAAIGRIPRLAEGTRIYDALDRSLALLTAADVKNGSIVLLSDGADVGSGTTRDGVLGRLAANHVRTFTVGLVSGAYDAAALQHVAAATAASSATARTPSDLAPIFGDLGYRLSSEYLLSYRSLGEPGTSMRVRVDVAGYPTPLLARYRTPELQLHAAPPYHESLLDRLVQSPLTMLLVALAVAGAFGFAIAGLIRPRGSLVERMSGFLTLAPPRKETARRERAPAPAAARTRTFAGLGRWQRLQSTLEIAAIPLTALQLVGLVAVATLGVALLLSLLLGIFGFVIALVVGPIVARGAVNARLHRRRTQFADQLPDNIEMLASALRAGQSLASALAVVVDNAAEPSRSELSRVVAEEQLGVQLEDALAVVVERMDNRELDQVALVARLQRDTGSNTAEVLDRVVETIRGRTELRRLVKTLTAQGRLSRWILTAVPAAMAGAMALLSPGYLDPLFERTSGRFVLTVATLMMVAGSLVMRRIIDIKV